MITKTWIVLGNLITTAGGCALASQGRLDLSIILPTALGLSFLIASAAIINNCIDRTADARMPQTQKRELVVGKITLAQAIALGTLLGSIGLFVLALYTNMLTLSIAAGGFLVYTIMYTLLKYRTWLAFFVGSISGGIPPVAGYCAVTNQLDSCALLLFGILVFWQMPHFYSIAIHRREEYQAASLPVVTVSQSIFSAKLCSSISILAFLCTAFLFTFLGYTGTLYLIVMAKMGLGWFLLSLRGFRAKDEKAWARKMFYYSLVIICIFSSMIFLDGVQSRTM